VFTSQRADGDDAAYAEAAARMAALAEGIPGFLGLESARGADGLGITVSYWADEAAIAAWRNLPAHVEAQAQGKAGWYTRYEMRIARVERAYGGP
jgi:heme-degrading monooxygenase HmoA